MLDVLLVNPRFNGRSELPPLGLLALASVLLKDSVSVRIADLDTGSPGEAEDCLAEALGENPRIVGVTAMTDSFRSALEVCGRAKASNPGILTVMGGVHATILHEALLDGNDAIDAVVRGEGEFAFAEIVGRVLSGEGLEGIDGLTYRRGAERVSERDRGLIENLDSLPLPAHHLVDGGRYRARNLSSSRGCSRNCVYCSIRSLYRGEVRMRGVESVMAEIEQLSRLGAERVLFTDDNFTFSLPRVRDICREIIRRGLHGRIQFYAEGRIDDICRNPLMAGVLSEAGFRGLYAGAESGSVEILRYYRKGITPDDVLRAVSICVEQNLTPVVSFILCGPMDTAETIRETVALARKAFEAGAEIAYTEALIPYYGTPIQEALERDGKFRRSGEVYYFESYRDMSLERFLHLMNMARRLARLIRGDDPLFESRRVYYEMGCLDDLLSRRVPEALEKARGGSGEAETLYGEIIAVVSGEGRPPA